MGVAETRAEKAASFPKRLRRNDKETRKEGRKEGSHERRTHKSHGSDLRKRHQINLKLYKPNKNQWRNRSQQVGILWGRVPCLIWKRETSWPWTAICTKRFSAIEQWGFGFQLLNNTRAKNEGQQKKEVEKSQDQQLKSSSLSSKHEIKMKRKRFQ